MPVAWMCPSGLGQIQTSSHAGGIASWTIRSIASASVTRRPSSSRYSNPLPRRRRLRPGPEQSTFRSRRATDPCCPVASRLNLAADREGLLEELGRRAGVAARADPEVEADRERIAGLIGQGDGGAGLAGDELPGRDVNGPARPQAEHGVEAAGRDEAKRERDRS